VSAWGEHAGNRPHRHLFRRRPAPVSRPEGQGFLLGAADAALVRAALADAAAYRESVMRACGQCWPYLPCDDHIHGRPGRRGLPPVRRADTGPAVSYADHDHRGDYADQRHDHDGDYAELHHRHYDLEREDKTLGKETHELREEILRLHSRLDDALERIRALECQTPQARQLQLEPDLAAADLAESGHDREYDPGPEGNDEGGMPEYRYLLPEDYERGQS